MCTLPVPIQYDECNKWWNVWYWDSTWHGGALVGHQTRD